MKRPIQTVVRYSLQEYEHVKRRADESGLTAASYLREISLGDAPRRRGVLDRAAQREIWKQVAGLGRNLNQIARRANVDGAHAIMGGELAELTKAVHRITETILELAGRKK